MIEDLKRRTAEIIERLKEAYPNARCALNHATPFELLVATILSAQCTDERVNIVTATLFRKYPDAPAFARADLRELERDIHSTGFFRNKAKNIRAASARIIDVYLGEVPAVMEDLLSLAGVARKTANVVLGNAFGIASGVVVDTHVARLSQRLGLVNTATPEKIEVELQNIVPKRHWIMFSHWLISHGRAICRARKPRCFECVLADQCPSFAIFTAADAATTSPPLRNNR